jgi:hypothetical protein
MGEKKGQSYFRAELGPRGGKHIYQSYTIFGKVEARIEVYRRRMFDAEYLRNQFFPEVISGDESERGRVAGDKSHAVMMIHREMDSMVRLGGLDSGDQG